MSSVPALTAGMLPITGASTSFAPWSSAPSASSRAAAGPTVPMSTMVLSAPAANTPLGPKYTSRSACGPVTMVISTSAPRDRAPHLSGSEYSNLFHGLRMRAPQIRIIPLHADRTALLLGENFVLFGEEEGGPGRVDEMRLVRARRPPLGRAPGRLEGGEVIEPELGHAVERRRHVRRMRHRMALDQAPQPGNPPSDWAVDIAPVAGELLEAHPSPAGDAVNQLDHGRAAEHTICVAFLVWRARRLVRRA